MSHVDDGALHAYLDGELPPVERARLEAHVAECPACRTRLEEERALVERASRLLGLAQPPERAAPPPLHELQRPRLLWRLRVPLAWAASVVLALGLGYYAGGARFQGASPPRDSGIVPDVADAQMVVADSAGVPAAPTRGAQRRPGAAPPAERESLANRVTDRLAAKTDSVNVAAGVAAVVTSRAEPDLAAARGRLVATEWPVIQREPARELLGTDPVAISGLAVRDIRRSPAGDVVVVEQALDSGTVIQLFQQRATPERELRRDAPAARAGQAFERAFTERLARFVGALRVEIAGPLSSDSLNKLLDRLNPIPPPGATQSAPPPR